MRSRDARARLDRLVAELRAQPRPVPPEELSSRLRAEFRRVSAAAGPALGAAASQAGASRPRVVGGARLPRLAAVSALALGAAFVAGRWARSSGPRPAPSAPTAVSAPSAAWPGTSPGLGAGAVSLLEGEPLALGTPVTALEQPRRVEHPGRASWVLAPGSRGRVLSAAHGVLRIALEQGSLDAEVLPSPGALTQPRDPAESFIVEARGTEIAVHGTRFVVTLSGQRTRVAVSQGQVVVRPLGQHLGTTLAAGMSAEFRAGVVEPAVPPVPPVPAEPATSSPSSAPSAAAASSPSGVPGAAAPARAVLRPVRPLSAAAAPAGKAAPAREAAPQRAASGRHSPLPAPSSRQSQAPSAASVESALRAITERVQDCFRRHTSGPSELAIELATELAFSVEPSGELLQADFEPPLAPAVEACVAAELQPLRLAPSPEGYRVQREIRLHR